MTGQLLVVLGLVTCLAGGASPLGAQIRGVVGNDSGRPEPFATVTLTGLRGEQGVMAGQDGRFVFRTFHDSAAVVWLQAFNVGIGGRFSTRVRATLRDTAVHLAIHWPPRTGLVAQRTLLTAQPIQDRTYDSTQIICIGPQCSIMVSDNIGRVYCWTTIIGARRDTAVEHVWYWRDREMARIRLQVHGARWRTWSSKEIPPGWTGKWRVEIVALDGTPLDLRFLDVQSARPVITAADLRGTDAENAFEAVRQLRLRWIGHGGRREPAVVRVDGALREASWRVLAGIPRDSVRSIRWSDSAGGTIDVSTRHGR
jgi:hypothetical protein